MGSDAAESIVPPRASSQRKSSECVLVSAYAGSHENINAQIGGFRTAKSKRRFAELRRVDASR